MLTQRWQGISLAVALVGPFLSVAMGQDRPPPEDRVGAEPSADERREQARSRREAAESARREGLLAKAGRELFAAWQLTPDDGPLALEAAGTLLEIDDYQSARQITRAVLAKLSEQVEQLQQYESALDQHIEERLRAGVDQINDGCMPNALAEFEAAIRIDPEQGELYVYRARALARMQKTADAIEALRAAVRHGLRDVDQLIEFPAFCTLWRDAGYLAFMNDAFGPPGVQAALDYCDGKVATRVGNGIALLHRGQFKEALFEFNAALTMDSSNPELYLFRARALAWLDQKAAAIQALRDAVGHGCREPTRLTAFPVFRVVWDEPDYAKLIRDEFGPEVLEELKHTRNG